jgi:RNA recognition motif-containing protein
LVRIITFRQRLYISPIAEDNKQVLYIDANMMSTQQPHTAGTSTVVSDIMPQVNGSSEEILFGIQSDNTLQNEGQKEVINHYIHHEDQNDHQNQSQDQEITEDDCSTEEINSDCSGDAVKIFVGQVPRNMEEADLFPIFERFGPMEDVAIIRDKHTGQHRGCGFVTFCSKESADACEQEMHNNYVFPGGKRPVQIRPAGRKDGKCLLLLLKLKAHITF